MGSHKYAHDFYLKNRDRILISTAKWKAANPDRVKLQRLRYCAKNREKIRLYSLKYSRENREKRRQYYRDNREKNRFKRSLLAKKLSFEGTRPAALRLAKLQRRSLVAVRILAAACQNRNAGVV